MLYSLKHNWQEYLNEAWGLGMFMVSACFFAVLLFHRNSPVIELNLILRNLLMGIAMGATAVGIILSPWGKRSGAHINPSVTLTFLRLGKIRSRDALFYILAQFAGGFAGVLISWMILGERLSDQSVNFVATVPGKSGTFAAIAAEIVISFLMMTAVLITTNSIKLSRFTPVFAGLLLAVFITVESPLSGMSMNPARSFGSAVIANTWTDLWIYFLAPPVAMLLAGEAYLRVNGAKNIYCAKFYHHGKQRCIFNCRFNELGTDRKSVEVSGKITVLPVERGLL